MSIWTGKTFEITKTWGDDRWFMLPSGKHPLFRLREFPGTDRFYYHVEFDADKMHPHWSTAWLLDIGAGYARRLRQKGAPSRDVLADVDRLEGFMQVKIGNDVRTDHILMEYKQGKTGNLANDLVVISLKFADSPSTDEEGGGSGPPH
jgi:hypothetical protein